MMRAIISAIVAISMCLTTPALAQYYSNSNNRAVHNIGASRGGIIGIAVDMTTYRCGVETCVRVTEINGTNFTGLSVGDYIVQVNNVYFSSVDQFFGLIRENAPGTTVRIDYWEASNNLRSMYQQAQLRGSSSSGTTSLAALRGDLETILRADAQYWDVSTYHTNSLGNLYVASSNGQNYVIAGTYVYDGAMSSNNRDSVEFHFNGGNFSCIRYGGSTCRSLRNQSMLGPVLVAAGVIVVAIIASNAGGSSESGGGGYSGQSRSQCLSSCGQMGVDPNPNVAAATVAQCQRRC